MSKFNYKARSISGELKEGEIEAASVREAAGSLATQGYIPISIDEQGGSFFKIPKDFKIPFLSPRVKMRDLNVFFRQVAVLVEAGVPLLEAIMAVEDQIINVTFKKIIGEMESDIGAGHAFSQALAKHPTVFPELIVAMVAAGERSGTLDNVLERITMFYEKEITFQQKVKSAMRYPIIVLVALSAAFVFVITLVIPRFSSVYSALKSDLPLPTKILININYAIVHYWWLMTIVGLSAYYAIKFYGATPAGRARFDQLKLNTPVFGLLTIKVSLSRFFRMLATMISSGIPIIAGLETTMNTADNVIIAASIARIRDRVVSGAGLSGPMAEEKIFPSTAVQMVAVGEKSGNLDKMLSKSADYFDEETDYLIANLMSLMEPFIFLFLSVMVLILALVIFLPMWSMMDLYTK
ncbi:MAG: type II secretion system F family protein [Candidatus Margulisiibacteriota bacterium]